MGVSCSCETKDDTRPNNQQKAPAQQQPQIPKGNPHLANPDYQILNRFHLDQAKKDAFAQGKVLVVFFGRLTDSSCKTIIPSLNRLTTEKYQTQSISIKVDCDNSPEILNDDVTETARPYPWSKVYANLTFIGIVFENDEAGLEELIKKGIVALGNNGIVPPENNQVPEQKDNQPILEQKVYRFDSFFQNSYPNLQTAEQLTNLINLSANEKKVLFVYFSLEDEGGERFAPAFDRAAAAYQGDTIAAVCNLSVYPDVASAANFVLSSYPIVQTYSNGSRFEEIPERPDLDDNLRAAINSILKEEANNNAGGGEFDYGQQVEFTFTTISTQEELNQALENAISANKVLVAYFYKEGEHDEVNATFDRVGAENASKPVMFVKADANVATFIYESVGEIIFPVIQGYSGTVMTNQLNGPVDEGSLTNLILGTVAQLAN